MRNRLLFKSIIAGLVFSCITLCAFAKQDDTASGQPFKVRTITIDAGHGGKDPGAHGSYSLEKNVALAIAKKLRDAIHDQLPDINVVMTRSDDTFIPLDERSQIANRHNSNLFISIHCNSSPEGTAHIANKQKGVMVLIFSLHRQGEQMEAMRENSSIYIEKNYKETYASYDESDPTNLIILNAYMQKYRKQSILFGDLLMDQFKNVDNRVAIGVKEQSVLVLAHSAIPAVLIETGFINNPGEEDYLNSASGQDEIVAAIIASIKTYREDVDAK